jgi:hypothetical protein
MIPFYLDVGGLCQGLLPHVSQADMLLDSAATPATFQAPEQDTTEEENAKPERTPRAYLLTRQRLRRFDGLTAIDVRGFPDICQKMEIRYN